MGISVEVERLMDQRLGQMKLGTSTSEKELGTSISKSKSDGFGLGLKG